MDQNGVFAAYFMLELPDSLQERLAFDIAYRAADFDNGDFSFLGGVIPVEAALDFIGNVADGAPIRYYNLPMDTLRTLIVRQLSDGEPVWFGSDVGSRGDREKGLWSTECYDYEGTFGMDFTMTKGERLDYRESAMNHAMVITGVTLGEDGQPTKWKIENSWSDEHGDKGYYQMSADWFDQYVYQAVINRKYLTPEQCAEADREPIHLQPWDPMGTLAD